MQCHYSYSACGLGSDGTDRLVQLVQEKQHSKLSKSKDGTLYGSKITGGGSGGTVCVIGRNSIRSSEQILEVILFIFFLKRKLPLGSLRCYPCTKIQLVGWKDLAPSMFPSLNCWPCLLRVNCPLTFCVAFSCVVHSLL